MKLLGSILIACGIALAQHSGVPAPPQQSTVSNRVDSLREFSSSLEALSAKVSESVVQIFSSGYALSSDSDAGTNTAVITRQRATGSGVILSADGYIITNGHVVSRARHVRVRLPASGPHPAKIDVPGKTLEARIVGIDRETDIAVLKIESSGLTYLSLGDSDNLRQGQVVMAFGNPMGLENSVSMGVVSSVARQLKPDDPAIYVQTDAPINPGNSGGPLVDVDGNVMGINTLILSQSGGSEGLGFAVPSNIVANVYSQLRQNGHVRRGEIGASAQTVTPALASGLGLSQDWGAIVSDVDEGEAADKAGLRVGDIVLRINDRPIVNARQLQVNLYRYSVGQKVNLEVLRGEDKLTYPVEVTERKDDPQRFADLVDPARNTVARLGILGIEIDRAAAELLPELRQKYGIVVAARAGDSPFAGDSLQVGDVIYSANSQIVTTIESLNSIIAGLKETDPLVLQVEREGKLLYLTMTAE
jgi:serine protease Do